jgi:hypothetical protein
LITSTHAITLEVPRSQGNEDVMVTGPEQVTGDETSFFELIQTINEYLRFSIGAVCMGVLIFGGIQLITASGNEEKMKTANKLLMGALIGILIAVLSYAIVRLIINIL